VPANLPEENKEHYLGDGVYVSFDGYQLALRAESLTPNTIYLEPKTWLSLRAWLIGYPKLRDYMEGRD
jgi:hypothetical protein